MINPLALLITTMWDLSAGQTIASKKVKARREKKERKDSLSLEGKAGRRRRANKAWSQTADGSQGRGKGHLTELRGRSMYGPSVFLGEHAHVHVRCVQPEGGRCWGLSGHGVSMGQRCTSCQILWVKVWVTSVFVPTCMCFLLCVEQKSFFQ